MASCRNGNAFGDIEIEGNTFELVLKIMYLGSTIDRNNGIEEVANGCYFSVAKLFSSET